MIERIGKICWIGYNWHDLNCHTSIISSHLQHCGMDFLADDYLEKMSAINASFFVLPASSLTGFTSQSCSKNCSDQSN